MRIKIDGELCTGHGRCAKNAPGVYSLDDDGYAAARGSEFAVAAGGEDMAIRGMKSCPERAISAVEAIVST